MQTETLTAAYDDGFFEPFREGAARSAQVVVPLIIDLVRPGSVVDVGCGLATWLAAFSEAGVEDVTGIDGNHVNLDALAVSRDRFVAMDLNHPKPINRVFDLAISLEVAEHLPERCADEFVGFLVSLAPAVLFSAAVPGQEGVHHINPQWHDYWHQKFAERGYTALDPVRPVIWHDENVYLHYRQNIFLYVRADQCDPRAGDTQLARAPRANCLTLVDVDLIKANLSLGPILKRLPVQLFAAVKRRIGLR